MFSSVSPAIYILSISDTPGSLFSAALLVGNANALWPTASKATASTDTASLPATIKPVLTGSP